MRIWITIAVLVAIFAAFVAFGRSQNPNASSLATAGGLAGLVGKPAPNFSLPSVNDRQFSLNNLRGKKVVLFFNEGIMCYPACWNQMAALGSDGQLNNDQVVSASIVTDSLDSWKTALQKMPELGKGAILIDGDASVSRQYGMVSLASSMHPGVKPGHTFVIIDGNGIVRYTKDDPQMGVRNQLIIDELARF